MYLSRKNSTLEVEALMLVEKVLVDQLALAIADQGCRSEFVLKPVVFLGLTSKRSKNTPRKPSVKIYRTNIHIQGTEIFGK